MASIAIRGSSLDGWADCPRRQAASTYAGLFKQHGYNVKELQRWVTPLIGTAIHAGADFLNTEYIRSGLIPSVDDIRAATEHAIDKFRQILIKDSEEHDVRFTAKFPDMDAIRKHIAEYVQLYANSVLPQRKLEISEQHFKFELNENFHIQSTCDSYGFKKLYDLKSGAKTTPAHYQIGIYTFLLENSGYKVDEAQLDYLQRPKDNEPPQHIIIRYNATECKTMAKYMIARVMSDLTDFLHTGDLNVFMANPRSEACNSIMCPLYGGDLCGGWRNGKV